MQTGKAMIGITTFRKQRGWFEELIESTDADNKPIFPHLSISRICSACQLLKPAEMIKCKHADQLVDYNTDSQKLDTIKKIYGSNKSSFLREISGVNLSADKTIFEKKLIENLFNKSNFVNSNYNIDEIYISIDPNSGGHDQTGVTALYMDKSTNPFTSVVRFFYSEATHFFFSSLE